MDVKYKVLYLYSMEMTVSEYATHIGKSVPLVYKQIGEGKLLTETRFGLIIVRGVNKNYKKKSKVKQK